VISGGFWKKTSIVCVPGTQPWLLVVVRKSWTEPEFTTPAEGMKVVFRAEFDGLNVPVPLLFQLPVLTPVTVPESATLGLLLQTVRLFPASAVMATVICDTTAVTVNGGQPVWSLTSTANVP